MAKARALLEQGRLKNPKNDELWLAAVRTEKRAGNDKAAESALAKALQVWPVDWWRIGMLDYLLMFIMVLFVCAIPCCTTPVPCGMGMHVVHAHWAGSMTLCCLAQAATSYAAPAS